MRAHVLSIGSELLLGHLTDTNATFLAQELAANGVDLLGVTQVGDDRARIVAALRAALADAELVVCTGGVGPTEDDLTREAIADLAGQTPEIDPEVVDGIRRYFAARGLDMPERNAKQAWRIPAAELLPNPVGTAPGWFVRHDGRSVVAMPGVPREMTRMWREQALPRVRAGLSARFVRSVTLKTLGIGESKAEELLHDLVGAAHPVVATYAKDDGVHVRVTAVAADEAAAVAARDQAATEVRRRLADHIYAADDATLPGTLADLLARRGLALGAIEHGSGGRFGALLAAEPSAAGVLRGAIAIPAGSEPESALSGRAARLAGHARDHFGADLGLGLVVATQPDGDGLFAGTVEIALAGALDAAESAPTRAAFAEVQRRAALSAADLLRRALALP